MTKTELHNNIERFQTQIRELEIQADTQISSRTESVFNEDDEDFEEVPAEWLKTGRNEQCPCGSGKKFKHCHGKYI